MEWKEVNEAEGKEKEKGEEKDGGEVYENHCVKCVNEK